MSDHLIILPILLPLLTAILLLFLTRRSRWVHRVIGLLSVAALLVVNLQLAEIAATGAQPVYALGNWPPPFGIVLVLDRLSAIMLLVTSVLALFALLYSAGGDDRAGAHFPALFQFQLMGLGGAFLTGDLFNLFVFFEVLLIASYALLMHGGGPARSRAGFHYVVLNLTGSLCFLIGVGTLYGVTGTLNMADLAVAVSQATPGNQGLLAAAGLILLVVFGLKAAVLPLVFWLPATYSAATPAVAALFAVMTKVGVYAILRLYPLVFGPLAGELEGLAWDWLWPLGLATVILALLGCLAAERLRILVAWLVVLSTGTLLAIMSLGHADAYGALLFYLIHSTWVTGGLFLLAGLVKRQRGSAGDVLGSAPPMPGSLPLSVLFLIGAMAVIGLPPLSGFAAKVGLLQSTGMGAGTAWLWGVILVGGLVTLVALSRAASMLFWRHSAGHINNPHSLHPLTYGAALALLLTSPILSLMAEPVLNFTLAAGEQLARPETYIEAVLGNEPAGLASGLTEGAQP